MTNKEKKELRESKGGSEEKALEKNFNEQKEVLQALQVDVNTIRGSLQKIRDDFAELKNLSDLDHQKIEKSEIDEKYEKMRIHFVNFLYVLGGLFIAGGFAVIGIGFSLWNIAPSTTILALVYGLILSLGVGISMIFGAYHAGTNLKEYPGELGIKEVFGTKLLNMNVYLFIAFLVFIVCCVIAPISYFSFSILSP